MSHLWPSTGYEKANISALGSEPGQLDSYFPMCHAAVLGGSIYVVGSSRLGGWTLRVRWSFSLSCSFSLLPGRPRRAPLLSPSRASRGPPERGPRAPRARSRPAGQGRGPGGRPALARGPRGLVARLSGRAQLSWPFGHLALSWRPLGLSRQFFGPSWAAWAVFVGRSEARKGENAKLRASGHGCGYCTAWRVASLDPAPCSLFPMIYTSFVFFPRRRNGASLGPCPSPQRRRASVSGAVVPKFRRWCVQPVRVGGLAERSASPQLTEAGSSHRLGLTQTIPS